MIARRESGKRQMYMYLHINSPVCQLVEELCLDNKRTMYMYLYIYVWVAHMHTHTHTLPRPKKSSKLGTWPRLGMDKTTGCAYFTKVQVGLRLSTP